MCVLLCVSNLPGDLGYRSEATVNLVFTETSPSSITIRYLFSSMLSTNIILNIIEYGANGRGCEAAKLGSDQAAACFHT
jgi:hypothetical protein